MYVCLDCGEVFSEPMVDGSWTSAYDDRPYFEKACKCPHCGCEAYEEAGQCDYCGEYGLISTHGYICERCAATIAQHIVKRPDESAEWFADEERETVELNPLLALLFTTDEIEELLLRELRNVDKNSQAWLERVEKIVDRNADFIGSVAIDKTEIEEVWKNIED